jgi:hypothetical protein
MQEGRGKKLQRDIKKINIITEPEGKKIYIITKDGKKIIITLQRCEIISIQEINIITSNRIFLIAYCCALCKVSKYSIGGI